jgi:hypothetical protein
MFSVHKLGENADLWRDIMAAIRAKVKVQFLQM